MATVKDSFAAKLAFFHGFSAISTSGDSNNTGMSLAQAIAKSSHSILGNDVKMEGIPFSSTIAEAEANVSKIVTYNGSTFTTAPGPNPNSPVTLYVQVPLTEISGSNKQGYYFAGEDGNGFVNKWVSPLDALNGFSQSSGYAFRLYPVIGGTPTLVGSTTGAFLVNYNNGVICLQSDQVPGKGEATTWQSLRASFFVYTGQTLDTIDFSPTWGILN